jgi:microcystin-dependent protein
LASVPYAKYAENAIAIPSGMIMAFAGDTSKIPMGWMLCDGRALNRSDYPALYAAIGLAWGSGNGTTTFNIPETRGYFLRGSDGNAGNDPDKSSRTAIMLGGNVGNNVGSYQNDTFKSHNHNLSVNMRQAACGFSCGNNSLPIESWGNQQIGISNTGGSETRPKNVYVNYIIKL